MRQTFFILVGLAALACHKREPLGDDLLAALPPAPVAAPSQPDPDAEALAEARAQVARLRADLMNHMAGGMSPATDARAEAPSDEAGALADPIARSAGAESGWASLKLRNPENEGPTWVRTWLTGADAGALPVAAGLSEVVDANGARVAHVLEPIVADGRCLSCHGDPATIPADVHTALERYYPGDQATGYKAGDLRGALWAEVAVAPAAR